MRGKLLQELLDPMFLSDRVHVRDLVLGQCGKVEMNLEAGKKRNIKLGSGRSRRKKSGSQSGNSVSRDFRKTEVDL